MRPTLLLLALTAPALAGYGDAAGGARAAAPEQAYTVTATVLDDGDGPQACIAVQTSLPPQCGGPAVVGWDWRTVEHADVGGVRWGEFTLTGTWGGRTLTLTRPPAPPDDITADEPPEESLETPCPEPAGGWRPGTYDDTGLGRAAEVADTLPDVGSVFVDEGRGSLEGLTDEQVDALVEAPPPRMVLNVSVVGGEVERAAVEQRLRETWDGDVCVVSGARTTVAEKDRMVEEIADALSGDDAWLSGVGRGAESVDVDVFVDDGTLQRELDDRYGEGAVHVTSAMQPVEG